MFHAGGKSFPRLCFDHPARAISIHLWSFETFQLLTSSFCIVWYAAKSFSVALNVASSLQKFRCITWDLWLLRIFQEFINFSRSLLHNSRIIFEQRKSLFCSFFLSFRQSLNLWVFIRFFIWWQSRRRISWWQRRASFLNRFEWISEASQEENFLPRSEQIKRFVFAWKSFLNEIFDVCSTRRWKLLEAFVKNRCELFSGGKHHLTTHLFTSQAFTFSDAEPSSLSLYFRSSEPTRSGRAAH